jgi:hypothetical protein
MIKRCVAIFFASGSAGEMDKEVSDLLEAAQRGSGYKNLVRIRRSLATSLRPSLLQVGKIYVALNTFLAENEWSKIRESEIDRKWNDKGLEHDKKRVRLVTRYEQNGEGRREVNYAGISFEVFLKGSDRFPEIAYAGRFFDVVRDEFFGKKPEDKIPGPRSENIIGSESYVSRDGKLVYQLVDQEAPYAEFPKKHYIMARLDPPTQPKPSSPASS